jgi:pyruvate decarboxylase
MYEKMAEHITAATVVLKDASTATQEIDRVLAVMLEQSRPVYIGVPTDIAYAHVSKEGLKVLLPASLPPNDKTTEGNVVATIRSLLENASKPAVIVDGGEISPLRLSHLIKCVA